MLLVIDAGNTELVAGLFDGEQLVDHWRATSHAERSADELALLLRAFLAVHDHDFDDVSGLAVASVVPRITASLREIGPRYFGLETMVLEVGIRTGMPILFDNPKEVGSDRIANAVAALDAYQPPIVVVDFSGTATVLDAVSAKGEYIGAVLVPGVEVGLEALVGRAALLRGVEILEAPPRAVIGRSSQESIQSGIVHGVGALVDGVVARMERELGDRATVVVTGSLGELMARFCARVDHVDPWLTLRGLRLVHEKNRP
jgi:type III pantothenate kinase